MTTEKDVSCTFMELWPFLLLGATGGFIKAINHKTVCIRDLMIRMLTGAFCAVLAGLYFKTTLMPIELQFAVAGASGVAGGDLIQALMSRMHHEITGENKTNESNTYFNVHYEGSPDMGATDDWINPNGNNPANSQSDEGEASNTD